MAASFSELQIPERGIAWVAAAALALAPVVASAGPAAVENEASTSDAPPSAAPEATPVAPPAEAPPTDATPTSPASSETDQAEANEDATATPDATEADDTEAEDTEADDTEADDTEADDTEADDTETDDTETDDTEADDTDDGAESTLPPLTTLQRAGWWTLFSAFTAGSVAGVFAGLAERQEDRAVRLANRFELETAAQPQYSEVADEYEQYLDRGRAYQRVAIGFAVVTGITAVAGITLFAIDAKRRRTRKTEAAPHVRLGAGSVEVRF